MKSKKSRKKDEELEKAHQEMETLLSEPTEPLLFPSESKLLKTKKKSHKIKKNLEQVSENTDDEDDEQEPVVISKNNKKSAFQFLDLEDENEDEDDESTSNNNNNNNNSETESIKNVVVEHKTEKNKKKKKVPKSKPETKTEDLDAVLAELNLETFEGKNTEASRKKKEKKEKQKSLAAQKKKNEDISGNKDQVDKESSEHVFHNESDGGEIDGGEDKKKKKGKKAEEEENKRKKKLTKGRLLAMQEALKKVQEEERKVREEEERKIAEEEAAEASRLEAKRLLENKKLAKKERERVKKEQLRKEGKYLSNKQKIAKAQAEAMLAAMKAGGLDVPSPPEKHTSRPGTRLRKKVNKTPSEKDTNFGPESSSSSPPLAPAEQPLNSLSPLSESQENENNNNIEESQSQKTPLAEEIQDTKEGLEKDNDIKDSWDASSSSDEEKENEKKKTQTINKTKSNSTKDENDIVDKEPPCSSSDENEDDDDDESSNEDDSPDISSDEMTKESKVIARIEKRRGENTAKRSSSHLRAPVVCVLGHVDTGKTKILDKLRRTNVQDGEAGGITQQIGATNVPIDVIAEQCKNVKGFTEQSLKLPGLLIIDTPGHESFSNLRDRGSSLCDIAILVVDIMHNLEPQTIESLNLLKKKKTPFLVALNKIDRLYEWKSNRHKDIEDVVKSQASNTQLEFTQRTKEVILSLAEQGLNAALFWENPDSKTYISIVPTSAHTGEGMGNLMYLLVSLSQSMLAKRLSYSEELQATVLEVKAISGLGTTIDIVLINGELREGSTIVVAGTEGPIVTQIKALLTPAKMQDLRVKVNYVEHKVLKAAQGVKIAAKNLEQAIAGLNMLVAYQADEIDFCKREIQSSLDTVLNSIKLKQEGVFVQASTLGSLEALLEFLKTSKIPYAGVKIGPVVKRDVMKASVMLEHNENYTVILAFDVKIERDAQELADSIGVKIFQADIIYHLFDRFTAYQDELKRQKREAFKHIAVFPCKLKILPNFVFNSRDPIVAGFIVEAGIVRSGTPVCVPSKEFLDIGVVTSIQNNHKEQEFARKGDEVCIKIEPIPGESPKMFGRHFEETDIIVSKVSRASIDACKDYFRDDLQKSDWQLMVELKKLFEIL